jgi:hypothetical protein
VAGTVGEPGLEVQLEAINQNMEAMIQDMEAINQDMEAISQDQAAIKQGLAAIKQGLGVISKNNQHLLNGRKEMKILMRNDYPRKHNMLHGARQLLPLQREAASANKYRRARAR